jgi:hypothetical protein
VCSEFRDCGGEHDDAEDETVVQEDEAKVTDDAEGISVREGKDLRNGRCHCCRMQSVDIEHC